MNATPLRAILNVLDHDAGAVTVAHAENLPRGDRERALRNAGLALATPPLTLWRSHWPGIIFECWSAGDLRHDLLLTPAGSLARVTQVAVARALACDLPYDASLMRREVEVEPWLKGAADIPPAIAWIEAETYAPDHEVYEHARYDYGDDALLAVRGPLAPTATAYALCGARAAVWQDLGEQAPAAREALVAALARREQRKLAALRGAPADLLLLGGDAAQPDYSDDLARRYDLPLLLAAAQQAEAGGLRVGVEAGALPGALRDELAAGAKVCAWVARWGAAPGLPRTGALWLKLDRATLVAGSEQASAVAVWLLNAALDRGLVVDLDDAGLARCTDPAEREQLVAAAAAVLATVSGDGVG